MVSTEVKGINLRNILGTEKTTHRSTTNEMYQKIYKTQGGIFISSRVYLLEETQRTAERNQREGIENGAWLKLREKSGEVPRLPTVEERRTCEGTRTNLESLEVLEVLEILGVLEVLGILGVLEVLGVLGVHSDVTVNQFFEIHRDPRTRKT